MEFDTAVARAAQDTDEEITYPFTITERDEDTNRIVRKVECTALHPGEGQVMVLMTDLMSRRSTMGDQLAGLVDFITDILDDESRDYVVGRLMDRKDPFGIRDIQPIVEWLIEEWGGRPTKQPSDFAPSRKTGGQSSTRRTSKSTSSASRRTAS